MEMLLNCTSEEVAVSVREACQVYGPGGSCSGQVVGGPPPHFVRLQYRGITTAESISDSRKAYIYIKKYSAERCHEL
jgi:hypothetical protein